MKYLAKNESGDYVADLGMRGEYPWSSSVGRQVCFNGIVKEYWYPTEINPKGTTQLERDTEKFKTQVLGCTQEQFLSEWAQSEFEKRHAYARTTL